MLWLVIPHRELGSVVIRDMAVFIVLMGRRKTLISNNTEQPIIRHLPPPITVMLPDRFGAIVIGETTFASTYNMNSKREARQKALRECQPEKKQPCRIFTEYRNSCVSLAQGRDKKRGYLVAEFADKRGQASRKAMDKCSAQYDNCSIIIEEECSIAEPPR